MIRIKRPYLNTKYATTAYTAGLINNQAPTNYAYASLEALLEGEDRGGNKSLLPGAGGRPVTERPDARLAPEMLRDLPRQGSRAGTR
jgi:hypothetical protein